MTAPDKRGAAAADDWSRQPERSPVRLLRAMCWLSLRLGRRASRVLLWPVVAVYLLVSPGARRASRQFLSRALERAPRLADVARHAFAFAATIHDRIYLLNGRFDLFDIRVHGEDIIREAVARGDGAFLFGGHLGSFEAVRTVGRRYPALQLAVMMYQDNASALNEELAAINPAVRQDVIALGRLDAMLQARAYLQRGYLLGLLADRTLSRLATDPMRRCDFLGAPAPFATGPLRMAAMLRRPVLFMTGLYRGGNRYDIHFDTIADFSATPAGERDAAVEAALLRYVALLERHARSAPDNWFNFYDFWQAPAQADVPAPAPERCR